MHQCHASTPPSTEHAGLRTLTPRFELGQVVGTHGFVDLYPNQLLLQSAIHLIMMKYLFGDWGVLCETDKQANERALDADNPDRIFAKYNIRAQSGEYVDIYVVTEWDRSVTTLLLPSEY